MAGMSVCVYRYWKVVVELEVGEGEGEMCMFEGGMCCTDGGGGSYELLAHNPAKPHHHRRSSIIVEHLRAIRPPSSH
jgi:hypothetical protein